MEKKDYKTNCFDTAIAKFLTHIESLWTTMPIVLRAIESAQSTADSNYNQFLKKNCEYVESQKHYIIPPQHSRKNIVLRNAAQNSKAAVKIIKRNFLVSLISQFDTYIADLMRCVFIINPELLNASEKKISYSDLIAFGTLSAAQDFIIEKEVETLLRESHIEQFKWFEKKLSIALRKDLDIWSTFIEMTQRRNIFVHNDGKISNQYITVCKENGVRDLREYKVGDELDIDIKYFEKAFRALFEIGVKLEQVIRRHLVSEEIERADISFLNISFELIQNKQYELAKELYDFSDKYIKKYNSNDMKLRILLNRAQTYKWLNEEEQCEKIIRSVDWTAFSDLFKMCSFVLLNDFTKAAKIMKNIGNNESIINKNNYKDWPIFKRFINSDEFKATYLDIYSEELEVIEQVV